MHETLGEVGSTSKPPPFFSLRRASTGTIDMIGPEKALLWRAFDFIEFSRPGLKEGRRGMEKEFAFERKLKILVAFALGGFSMEAPMKRFLSTLRIYG